MRARWLNVWAPALLALSACAADDGSTGGRDGGRDTGRSDAANRDGGSTHPDVVIGPCVDSDGDGISDQIEGMGDLDRDGIPNFMDDDSDGDGFSDRDEGIRNYPGFPSSSMPLSCGQAPDNCDADDLPNDEDLDADNDGLTDAEENTAHTNPCAADTDGDGIDDLTERAAMSDPTSSTSTPPTGSLYVTLPYHPPGEMGEHVHREFTFSTRLRAADIFFLSDTTGSMMATITAVRNSLQSVIVPGIRTALGVDGDARYGLGDHRDFAEGGSGGDYALNILQPLTRDVAAVQAATARLALGNGNDYPEAQVPAMHSLISGFGLPQYAGTATRMVNPPVDCHTGPDDPETYGWGCFQVGRVPIIVLFSDAQWHNGPADTSNFYSSVPMAARYAQLVTEMTRRGAYYVGIDVNNFGQRDMFNNSLQLATATHTLDGAGRAIAFQGQASEVAARVIDAITTIAGQSRQDITTRTDPDTMERRLMSPHTTRDFVRAVVPARGIPDAPTGFDRHDDTTFYNVAPSTQVIFGVDFYNDFQPGGTAAQLFRARIVVLGRAAAEVDHRDVFVIVPASGGGPPG